MLSNNRCLRGGVLAVLGLVLAAAGCGGGSGGAGGGSAVNKAVNDLNATTYAVATQRQNISDAIYEMIRIASKDFTVHLSAPETGAAPALTQAEVNDYTDALAAASQEVDRMFRPAWNLVLASKAVGVLDLQKAPAGGQVRVWTFDTTGSGGPVPHQQSLRFEPFTMLICGAVVGSVMLYNSLKGTMDDAVEARSEPVMEKIDNATDEEVQVIAESMGETATTKEELKEAMKTKSAKEKLDAVKSVEGDLVLESATMANVTPIEAEKINGSVAKSGQLAGTKAVELVVSNVTGAAGGQGVAQLAEFAGATEGAAALIDIGVGIANVQPLDLWGKGLNVMTVAEEKKQQPVLSAENLPVEGTPAPTNAEVAAALNTLEDSKAGMAEKKAAADKVAIAMVHEAGDGTIQLIPPTGSTTEVLASLPKNAQVTVIDDARGQNTIQVPAGTTTTVILSGFGYVPEAIEEVPANGGGQVTFEAKTIKTYEAEQKPEEEEEDPEELPDTADACGWWAEQFGDGTCKTNYNTFYYCAESGAWYCACGSVEPWPNGEWEVRDCDDYCASLRLGKSTQCDGTNDAEGKMICECADDTVFDDNPGACQWRNFFISNTNPDLGFNPERCIDEYSESISEDVLSNGGVACMFNSTTLVSTEMYCGNGSLQFGDCDDGNKDTFDVCAAHCVAGAGCNNIAATVPDSLKCTETENYKFQCVAAPGSAVDLGDATYPLTMVVMCTKEGEAYKPVIKDACFCEPTTTWVDGTAITASFKGSCSIL